MYVIVILLKYIFEWCIWYTLDWAVFKGWALRISPSSYEQVTWILETAQALGLLKHMYSFLKKKTFLWFSNVSSVNLPDPALCNDMHYMNSVSSTAATKLLTSQYTVTCFSVPPFDQGLHSLERSLNFRGSPWKVLDFLQLWM